MDFGKFLKDFIIIFIIISIIAWMFDFIKKMFTKETAVAYWAIFLTTIISFYIMS
jgi:hypothetical protein